eukprot:15453379-Alexandrium_andersonii.AAC.1
MVGLARLATDRCAWASCADRPVAVRRPGDKAWAGGGRGRRRGSRRTGRRPSCLPPKGAACATAPGPTDATGDGQGRP